MADLKTCAAVPALPIGMRCLLAAGVFFALTGCASKYEVSSPPIVPERVAVSVSPGDCRGAWRSYAVKGQRYWVRALPPGHSEQGIASWYGQYFHGRQTASGETFDMRRLSAAHKTLPLNSIVRVTNLRNGRQVTVRINDRGPFVPKRLIDLSYAAAQQLDMVEDGVVEVEVTVVKLPSDYRIRTALLD